MRHTETTMEKTLNALEEAIKTKNMHHEERMHDEQLMSSLTSGDNWFVQTMQQTKHEIEEKPWAFLAKVAACSFGIGMLLASRAKHRASGGPS